ncbi:MAG: TetR/AcrR family transcriptional regulator [Lachnospiraceae bacterium]|nr:TetR/AcrR family transcriptional regulator [Lachnospiraceae bacterium]
MGRKTQISKEMIMEAAYELLEEGGIGAVAIKAIAARLNCSTQPVSWHYGSMIELKKELYRYSQIKLYRDLPAKMQGKEAIEAFFVSGLHYISNACDHPNVFKFICVDDPLETIGERVGGDTTIFNQQFDAGAAEMIAEQYNASPEAIGEIVRDTVIYTHGLALMMMYDNYRLPKKEACKMMYNMGAKLLREIGYEPSSDYETIAEKYL